MPLPLDTIPALLNDAAGLAIQDASDQGAPLHVARERFLAAAARKFDALAERKLAGREAK